MTSSVGNTSVRDVWVSASFALAFSSLNRIRGCNLRSSEGIINSPVQWPLSSFGVILGLFCVYRCSTKVFSALPTWLWLLELD
jgi:hypothetical protein